MGLVKMPACKCCCGARGLLLTLASVGMAFVVLGLVAQPTIYALMRWQIKSSVNMDDSSSTLFDIWSGKQSIPEFMTYYMFNVTNPDDVLTGSLPKLQVIGPYTYSESNQKFDIVWSADGNIVTYKYHRLFIPYGTPCVGPVSVDTLEPPYCTMDDSVNVTVGNSPLLGFIMQLMSIPVRGEIAEDAIGAVIDEFMRTHPQDTVFITRPVRDIIFGYNDSILSDVNRLIEFIDSIAPKLAKKLNLTLEPQFIGLQYNDTANIRTLNSSIYTGKDNWAQAFSYVEWAGNEKALHVWGGCPNTTEGLYLRHAGNLLNGTEGLQFRPLLDDDTYLPVYSQDLSRSALLYPTDTVTIKDIDLKRYRITPETLLNEKENPANCAFSMTGPSGVMNLSWVENAPIFASKPMFLDADASYRNGIMDGLLAANIDKHDTFLDIEPWTGACMHAHQRLQINLQFRNFSVIPELANITSAGFYLPIAWADEWAYISDDLANQWKDQVGLGLKVSKGLQIGGVAGGLSLIAIAAAIALIRRRTATGETEPLLGSSRNVNSEFDGSI